MTRAAFETRTCDRCGHSADVRAGTDAVGWSVVNGTRQTDRGPAHMADPGGEDWCPGCTDAFAKWRNAAAGTVEQPTPVPEPRRVRPAFTIEDRKAAVSAAAMMFKAAVMEGSGWPTEMQIKKLSGEVVDVVARALKVREDTDGKAD